MPLPEILIRLDNIDEIKKNEETEENKITFETIVIQKVNQTLKSDEMAIFDAGFALSSLLKANCERFGVRLPQNFVGRRNYLPPYTRGRPREFGLKVRPLARSYKDKVLEATQPDYTESWQEGELELKAEIWQDLVLSTQKAGQEKTFHVYAIYDPRYKKPLLLASPIKLKAASMRKLYQDRWPVEQLPLAAKQMIGAHRQFVFSKENCQRLPELSILAGSVLTYVAASLPPIPTGFWDRAPKSTPGRLRRAINKLPLLANLPLPARIRKKASIFSHLPHRILGHRRTKPT